MAIRFNCPKCDALIAFHDKHRGKRARCLTCGQVFVIPSKDNETPQEVEPKIDKAVPVPGFYRAIFVGSWKMLIDAENVTSLAFVIAVVCFKFFLDRAMCDCGYITFVFVWGWLLGFYLNIIYETALGIDKLPEIYLGTSITFLWYVVKPFLIFFLTVVAVQIPFIVALSLLRDKGLTVMNMWTLELGPRLILQSLFVLGLFFFPMAVLTVAVGKDITLLRPDYLLKPVSRAFMPYLIVVGLLVVVDVLETQTTQYTGAGFSTTAAHLMLNLAVQVAAIFAMRSIGLFYRHYAPHFSW
jgi:hypothetical protein